MIFADLEQQKIKKSWWFYLRTIKHPNMRLHAGALVRFAVMNGGLCASSKQQAF